MELVDIRDLKSRGPRGPCRFESGSGYQSSRLGQRNREAPSPFLLGLTRHSQEEWRMANILCARRRWLVAAAGFSLFAGPAFAAPQSAAGKKSAESVAVTATEDLMREHGIVSRVLLIYGAGVRRLGHGEDVDPVVFTQAAEIMRDFVHDYHEKNEEEHVFPRFTKAGRMVELVNVLAAQHGACRKLTERVIELAPKSGSKTERE